MWNCRSLMVPVLVLAFAGALRAEGPDSRTFVGPCGDEKTARIGVVADDGMMVAYVCSQDETFNTGNARWFTGTVANGKLTGKSPDGRTLSATMTGNGIEGQITNGDGTLPFRAKLCDTTGTMAGLYRAEEKDGEHDYVAGWVVDEADHIAGAVNQRGQKKIQTPKPPAGPGAAANLSPRQGVQAQPIVSPRDPQSVKGKKTRRFTQEDADAKLAALQNDLGAQGGSATLAAVINQVKRFTSGAKPEGPIEAATFAKLAKLPKAQLQEYVRNWDGLPAQIRQQALGEAGTILAPNVALTPDAALNAYNRSARKLTPRTAAPSANNNNAANVSGVKSVRLTTIQCVNKADLVGKDEVFVTYLVATGANPGFDLSTGIYTFKKGDQQFFKAADAQVFPQAGTTQTANEDIFIGAGAFDDDSADKAKTLALVKTLIDVGATVLTLVGQPEIAAFAPAANDLFTGVVAALPDTVFIGSDALQVKPTKQAIGENGSPKSTLTMKRIGNNGKVKSQYEVKGLQIS